MSRKSALLLPVTLHVLFALAVPAYASPTNPRIPGPRKGTSSNWSGYAAATSLTSPKTGSVTDVKGVWTVTTITATPSDAYSSSWIGIDGYLSNTVEQIGTEADWRSGHAVYSAWYEMYPKWPVTITTMVVKPGDVMSADVSYIGNRKYQLTLKNLSTGVTYTTVQKSSGNRTSAEWVVEAPWSSGVLPLANFGTVPWTGCTATINGHTGGIGDSAWVNDPITMTGNSGNKAVPSALSSGGTAFTDTWYSSN